MNQDQAEPLSIEETLDSFFEKGCGPIQTLSSGLLPTITFPSIVYWPGRNHLTVSINSTMAFIPGDKIGFIFPNASSSSDRPNQIISLSSFCFYDYPIIRPLVK